MANREVNLTKLVRVPNGTGIVSRYCPVVITANGRIKVDAVRVDGREERHPEGAYYLDWREGTKRKRLSVGKNPIDALARYRIQEARLLAKSRGVQVVDDSVPKHDLAQSIALFLSEIKLTKKPKTHAAYSKSLEYFRECCSKKFVEEIERYDMLKFSAFLRDEKEQSPRSCWNKFSNVMTFLKAQGIHGLMKKHDWPQYTEEEPEIYEPEELDDLFKVCDSEERLWFEFFLMTGEREQEVMHTYWTDINLKAGTVRVTHKPDRGWTPKAYKERTIPIHDKLKESLKAWKAKTNGCNLVFPTSGCKPKLDFLDCLKTVAERAGLDKSNFWLHKFRATFATRALRAGNDLRTVQNWLGHSDIESTMRYLRADESDAVRSRVAAMF